MKNLLFYAGTVLIWGSTWLAIKFQLGAVDPMVSVAYRFSLASLVLLIYCRVRGVNMRFSGREHLFMALQGLFLFALNYWLFYLAGSHLPSGLVAVVFSSILVMNMVNGALFLGSALEARMVAGAALGLMGIGLVFWPELDSFDLSDQGMTGLLLCLGATLLASWGNILSARNQKKGLPVVQTNAYGMGYGALVMFLFSLLSGKSFGFEFSPTYIGSLLYLSVFGSIVAFGCYLSLIGRIGADRAAYATLVFPIVALYLSTVFESYRWSESGFIGIALILLGNVLILKRRSSPEKVPAEQRPGIEEVDRAARGAD